MLKKYNSFKTAGVDLTSHSSRKVKEEEEKKKKKEGEDIFISNFNFAVRIFGDI